MKYIILDLEWNSAHSVKGNFNEIIEIGAVSLDENMNITDKFQSLVKPKCAKKIRNRIEELTHISNDALKSAEGFVTVYNKFETWVGADDDNCLFSWGNCDLSVLYENLKHYDMLDSIYVIKHFCDAQLLCQKFCDISVEKQIGLVAFAELIGVGIDDLQQHRALNDSLITARCLVKAFTHELYLQFVKVTDKAFYERLHFKKYFIYSQNDERIRQNELMVKCPDCDVFMKRLTGFEIRNKKQYARYRCGECGRLYNISHSFKVTYDGIVHKNTLNEISAGMSDEHEDRDECEKTGSYDDSPVIA